ncbi:MAG: ATP-binding cassette domain-containing protein [Elusimicrobiaceae bacterium]|nr:ATP-binding cassette domain-containing protein [Elusimicrobiaceae bacterium]
MTALLEAKNLVRTYRMKTAFSGVKQVRAVDDVSLTVNPGEAHGIAGESGCGKTTLAKLLLRLEDADSGSVFFDGRDITALSGGALKAFRKQAQIIFQDPQSSLDPRMTVRELIEEPLVIHSTGDRAQRLETVIALMDKTGLSASFLDRYPHEFSGGQRQRIGVARALALNPRLIVADECVSALDVSIQAQILNLLKDLRAEFGLSYLFVSHDLSVMRFLCDRITVMHEGRAVETGPASQLLGAPRHPYTKTLLAAVPRHPCERT